jgi:hypothetical protein
MKLTPTVIVELGSLVCLAGTLCLAGLDLSPEEKDSLRALVAVILGLFFMQIGYARYVSDALRGDLEKRRPPGDRGD